MINLQNQTIEWKDFFEILLRDSMDGMLEKPTIKNCNIINIPDGVIIFKATKISKLFGLISLLEYLNYFCGFKMNGGEIIHNTFSH